MGVPDYAKQGYTDVTAVLEESVLTITIDPSQSYVPFIQLSRFQALDTYISPSDDLRSFQVVSSKIYCMSSICVIEMIASELLS